MSNKTPYEIRLEVLKMAQDAAIQNYHMNRDRLMTNWQVEVDTARSKGETPPPCPEFPDFPTEETVVKKAQFLSEYINNSGKQLKD